MNQVPGEMELYKLNDSLPIWKASALLLGIKPSEVMHLTEDVRDDDDEFVFSETSYKIKDVNRQGDFDAMMSAIISSVIFPKPPNMIIEDCDVPF
jgi:hypothetical protein